MRLSSTLFMMALVTLSLCHPGLLHSQSPAATPADLSIFQGGVRGLVISEAQTVLSSEISSSIVAFNVDTGDSFAKGDELVKFDCEIFQAELEKAQALQDEAEKTLEVNKKLESLSSVSELEVAVAKSKYDQTIADTKIKQYQVSRCTMWAPFTGRVVERVAAPFQYTTTGQPVLEIIDTRNIAVQVHLPSDFVSKINQTTTFAIRVEEVEKSYQGIVTALGSQIDSASQTIEIRGKLKDSHSELLPGMSGVVTFNLP